jgi:CubicO group peptidase (beta-lactamase class C family)
MKSRCRVVVLAGVLTALVAARATAGEPPWERFDEYAEAARVKWQVPGLSIAVVKDGEVVLVRGYGERTLGTNDRPTGRTVFRTASITKTFTAASAALLVDEGKLAWDEPIKKHVPEFELLDPYLTDHTSLRDCVSHRVGLETGDIVARRGDLTREEILSRLKFLQPYSPFRGKYKYNNLMYMAAGETVARAAGRPWEDFVSRRLLEPLGMKNTTPTFSRLGTDNLATPYRLHDGEVQAITTAPIIDAVAPAGSVHSTAEDMAQWLKFWLAEGQVNGRPILKRETVRHMLAMHSAVPIERQDGSNVYAAKFYGWGLGWSVLDYRGRKIHTHAGGSGTFIGFMPEEGIGVVVLTNLEFTNLGGMLMYDVFDAYLLAPERAWSRDAWPTWLAADEPPETTGNKARAKLDASRKAGTKPSLALASYAGTYHCDLYGPIEVQSAEGGLVLKLGSNPAVKLEHWQDDSFISPSPEADAPWFDWLLKFSVTDGRCGALDIERLGWDEPLPTFRFAGPPD